MWAHMGGFFWLPCPNCGRMFGGHEVGGQMYRNRWSHYGEATCSDPECMREVEARNARVLLHVD